MSAIDALFRDVGMVAVSGDLRVTPGRLRIELDLGWEDLDWNVGRGWGPPELSENRWRRCREERKRSVVGRAGGKEEGRGDSRMYYHDDQCEKMSSMILGEMGIQRLLN